MSVCTSRGPELCGFFTACNPCLCGAEVRERLTEPVPPKSVVRRLLEERAARVPDSAREDYR